MDRSLPGMAIEPDGSGGFLVHCSKPRDRWIRFTWDAAERVRQLRRPTPIRYQGTIWAIVEEGPRPDGGYLYRLGAWPPGEVPTEVFDLSVAGVLADDRRQAEAAFLRESGRASALIEFAAGFLPGWVQEDWGYRMNFSCTGATLKSAFLVLAFALASVVPMLAFQSRLLLLVAFLASVDSLWRIMWSWGGDRAIGPFPVEVVGWFFRR